MARPSAASRKGGADETIRIDASELGDIVKRLQVADKKMYAALRKALKQASDDVVKAAKDKVLEPPPEKVGSLKRGLKFTKRKDGSVRTRAVITGYNAREDATRTRSRGTRKAIANSIAASIPTAKSKSAQVTIRANAGKVPAAQKPMVKAYNSAKLFRHQVFGNGKWVYQSGNPYFGAEILARRDAMMREIRAAMDRFSKQL